MCTRRSRAHTYDRPVSERDQSYEVATAYYLQGETMEVIARRLGVSRSTVSRMLKSARESGLVQVSIDPQRRTTTRVEERLGRRWGVRVSVVDVRDSAGSTARLDAVAGVAGALVSSMIGDDQSLGVAWGLTVSAVVERMPPKRTRGATVVQLNGAANTRTSGIGYAGDILAHAAQALDAQAHYFPTPAFFDYPETKEALWREGVVQRVLALQRSVDVALFGVGSYRGDLPSHVYTGGYLTAEDMSGLVEQHVVGDVCTVFVRSDGSWEDVALNARASGPTPRDLAKVPRRVCVMAGPDKVPALAGALRSGVVTDLVLDDAAARALDRIDP